MKTLTRIAVLLILLPIRGRPGGITFCALPPAQTLQPDRHPDCTGTEGGRCSRSAGAQASLSTQENLRTFAAQVETERFPAKAGALSLWKADHGGNRAPRENRRLFEADLLYSL